MKTKLLLTTLLLHLFFFASLTGAAPVAKDEDAAQAVLTTIGDGSAMERLQRLTGGRAGWPTPEQAVEEYRFLRAYPDYASFLRYSHKETGVDAERVRRVIAPLFELHHAYVLISVIYMPANIVFMGRGAVLIISHQLLQVLDDDELFAMAGHELGHQYFRREYLAAEEAHDYDTLRTIELKCDAISVLSAIILERDPLALQRGFEWALGPIYDMTSAVNEDVYPSLKTRKQLIEQLARDASPKPLQRIASR